MALGPGLPIRMVCPSPFWRATSAVPMVPPAPAGGGKERRRVWVARQSAAWPRRGKAAVAENPAAADSTRRRESLVVTFHSLLRLLFCGEPRKCAGGRQADGLAQAL